ncbi:hypothetical protein [Prescottella equi]|uniref:hypothetical protein n=1 Tax=Rhodococcus hoagii TaxID=43767 RepID=UPI0013017893|nr:hypothetical protein [Prescottella equi]
MPDQDSGRPKPVAAGFLGFVAAALFVIATFGYFGDEGDVVTGALFLFGSAVAVIAAFSPHVQGTVKFSKDGAEFQIDRAERQLKSGASVSVEKLDEVLEAVGQAPGFEPPRAVKDGTPRQTDAPAKEPIEGSGPIPRETAVGLPKNEVRLVADAITTVLTLTTDERSRVYEQLHRMTDPEFDPSTDRRGHRRGQQGHAYRVRKVPGTGIRLWYRELGSGPSGERKLAVVVVDRKDELSWAERVEDPKVR